MAFERKSMVTFRPSSSRRTFSSRVPNKVSMLGLIPMLFFIQSLYSVLLTNRKNGHTSAISQTKQDYAWRRDQPECSCPGAKSLPLIKAYPPAAGSSTAITSIHLYPPPPHQPLPPP